MSQKKMGKSCHVRNIKCDVIEKYYYIRKEEFNRKQQQQ